MNKAKKYFSAAGSATWALQLGCLKNNRRTKK
jgi:hypothetical protein